MDSAQICDELTATFDLGIRRGTAVTQTARRLWRRCVLVASATLVLSAAPADARLNRPAACPPLHWNVHSYDYNSAEDRTHFGAIEYNHKFTPQSPTRGPEAATTSDIVFVVGYVPNHHRGLSALVRLSLETNHATPAYAQQPVECWLIRATVFRPDDGVVWRIYGSYLARLGATDEAIEKLKRAEASNPDDPVVAYNLGLLLCDKKDYEQALAYAKRAYAAGVDLPGLRNKLVRAGKWKD